MDHLDDDKPPFALAPEMNQPQHLFSSLKAGDKLSATTVKEPSRTGFDAFHSPLVKKSNVYSSQMSSSSPPGLAESVLTASSSEVDDSVETMDEGTLSSLESSSMYSLSSLPTIATDAGGASALPNSFLIGQHGGSSYRSNPGKIAQGSIGVSQLLRSADDTYSPHFSLQRSRMPVVPENASVEESCESGTLISAPTVIENTSVENYDSNWFPGLFPQSPRQQETGLREPLLLGQISEQTSGVVSPFAAALARAKTNVTSVLVDDQSFEVNMELPSIYSVDDVMDIIASPDKLRVWCHPIQSMVVTNGGDSDSNVENGREYEGEWIEGTTTALESPHDGIGWLYEVAQSILHSLGFASYGKITMFVERRRGQVGLTVGPFMGGIFAAHTIRVVEENGRVKVSPIEFVCGKKTTPCSQAFSSVVLWMIV